MSALPSFLEMKDVSLDRQSSSRRDGIKILRKNYIPSSHCHLDLVPDPVMVKTLNRIHSSVVC